MKGNNEQFTSFENQKRTAAPEACRK